eukprot:m.285808 g.285808  ORF g.285808 m.285808 type:complete len:948 (-) comp17774_c0_seq42:185-3028(-)
MAWRVLVLLTIHLSASQSQCQSLVPRFYDQPCLNRELGAICTVRCHDYLDTIGATFNFSCSGSPTSPEWVWVGDGNSSDALPWCLDVLGQFCTLELRQPGLLAECKPLARSSLKTMPVGFPADVARITMSGNDADSQLSVGNITADTLGSYPLLSGLELRNMQGNGFTPAVTFAMDAFENMTAFELLECVDVRLPTIPSFRSSYLKELVVSRSDSLTEIDFSQILLDMPNLKVLNLRDNAQVTTFVWHTFTAPSLLQLVLVAASCNVMDDIPWHHLPNLAEFTLDARDDKNCHVTTHSLPRTRQLLNLKVTASEVHSVVSEAVILAINKSAIALVMATLSPGLEFLVKAPVRIFDSGGAEDGTRCTSDIDGGLACSFCRNPKYINSSGCPVVDSFRCPGSTTLISPLQVCDGNRDCLDGHDEAYCAGQLVIPAVNFGCASSDVSIQIRNGLAHSPAYTAQVENKTVKCYEGNGFVYNWTAFELTYRWSSLKVVYSHTQNIDEHIFVGRMATVYKDGLFQQSFPSFVLKQGQLGGLRAPTSLGVVKIAPTDENDFNRLWAEARGTALFVPDVSGNVTEKGSKSLNPAAVAVPVVVVAILLGVGVLLYQRQKQNQRVHAHNSTLQHDFSKAMGLAHEEYCNTHPKLGYTPILQVPRRELAMERELGEGHFGRVVKARWQRAEEAQAAVVAVKLVTADSTEVLAAWLTEVFLLQAICQHERIMTFHGISLPDERSTQTELAMIMELAPFGDLRSCLRGRSNRLSAGLELQIAAQIAQGMVYLHANNVVHRDLAARNVLVFEMTEAQAVVKLSDFGLSKALSVDDTYYRARSLDDLPFRWMPLEAIRQRKFSQASDVWSYGVVLYELTSQGKTPYKGKDLTGIVQQLVAGQTLELPPSTAQSLQAICKEVWQRDPHLRPSFEHVLIMLTTATVQSSDKGFNISNHEEESSL